MKTDHRAVTIRPAAAPIQAKGVEPDIVVPHQIIEEEVTEKNACSRSATWPTTWKEWRQKGPGRKPKASEPQKPNAKDKEKGKDTDKPSDATGQDPAEPAQRRETGQGQPGAAKALDILIGHELSKNWAMAKKRAQSKRGGPQTLPGPRFFPCKP